MKNIILIICIGLIVSSCISIDSRSNDLSKNQQRFTEGKSYIFSITPSYNSEKDRSPIEDLGRYFYLYKKGGKYVRITPKFSSQELIAEILNENKKVIDERNLKLLSYLKENLDKSRESKTLYFNDKYEILKKSNYSVADLGQSWGYYTALTFLDQNGNLVITEKTTDLSLIFLIPVGGKTVSSNIFNKVE
ncbi:hypothetical protein [Acinetobacter rudis]|uniref:hypothetical protein n=1 Tax=Acinetobacter rudis TaxID=632955 RepID=UPI0005A5F1A4|nr:hypothetical protein [Acinetobacter rudis]